MTPGKLYRLAGWSLAVGSIIVLVTTLLNVVYIPAIKGEATPLGLVVQLIGMLGALLFLLGLPACYLYQAERSGKAGLFGFIFTFCGVVLGNIGYAVLSTFIIPYIGQLDARGLSNFIPALGVPMFAIVVALILFVGYFLLGVATIKAGLFSRAVGWVLIAACIMDLVAAIPIPLFNQLAESMSSVIAYIGFAWLGFLVSSRGSVVDMEQATAPVASQAN